MDSKLYPNQKIGDFSVQEVQGKSLQNSHLDQGEFIPKRNKIEQIRYASTHCHIYPQRIKFCSVCNFPKTIYANTANKMKIMCVCHVCNTKETINYSYGFPLQFNGDVNPNFDRGPATRWKEIRFQGTNSHVVRNPMEEDKFRHRSICNLTVRTIK